MGKFRILLPTQTPIVNVSVLLRAIDKSLCEVHGGGMIGILYYSMASASWAFAVSELICLTSLACPPLGGHCWQQDYER